MINNQPVSNNVSIPAVDPNKEVIDNLVLLKPKPFTQLSLDVVAEYLDPVKRALIVRRSKNQFASSDKIAPYRIETLRVEPGFFAINNKLELHSKDGKHWKQFENMFRREHSPYIKNLMVKTTNIPKGILFKADRLEFSNYSHNFLTETLPYIHPDYLPLKYLMIWPKSVRDPIWTHDQLSTTSKALYIYPYPAIDIDLKKITHPNAYILQYNVSVTKWILLLKKLCSGPKTVGNRFTVITREVKKYLDCVEKHTNASKGILPWQWPPRTRSVYDRQIWIIPGLSTDPKVVIHVTKAPFFDQELKTADPILYGVTMEVMENASFMRV